VCACVCVPTTLLIAVVPAIVVPVAVPQAADAVAVLAVELVFLAVPGSCREREEERKEREGSCHEDTTKKGKAGSVRGRDGWGVLIDEVDVPRLVDSLMHTTNYKKRQS